MPVITGAPVLLIRISVHGGKLSVNPRGKGEVTIYHHDPSVGPPTPGRPNEAAWLEMGLAPDQKIVVKAKTGSRGRGYMAKDDYGPITTTNPYVFSGLTKKGPARGMTETWSYSVELLDAQGNQLDLVDPDVDIEPDP